MKQPPFPFTKDDSGAGTAWWVFWMISFLIFGGLAADSANAWRMRAELQATADAAAHAGAVGLPNVANAVSAAQTFAETNMPMSVHGDVLSAADVQVGTWNSVSKTFSVAADDDDDGDDGGPYDDGGVLGVYTPPPGPGISPAIRVVTRRDATNANRLRTSFLRLVGMASWNVSAEAVAERYFPDCNKSGGLFARRIVDLQSNNRFRPGICIHGNDHVEVNNNNIWDPGVTVTMPDLSDLEVPSSDIDVQNPGLRDALGEEYFDPKIVDYVGQIIASLTDLSSPFIPDYIGVDALGNIIPTGDIVKNVTAAQLRNIGLQPGYIYNVNCAGNSLLNLSTFPNTIEKVVLISQCRIFTGQGKLLQDVVIASKAGDVDKSQPYPNSVNIGQSNQLGANDNCAITGNVKLLSSGGSIRSAAQITAYGLQAIAVQDIELTANSAGLSGVLLQAGKDVSITSNNAFGNNCDDLDAWQVAYYRLVL